MANERDVLGIVLQSSSEGTGFDTVQKDITETERHGQDAAKNLESSYQESFTAIRNASALAFAAVAAGIGFAVREAAAGERGVAEFASSVRNAGGDADELSERLNATAMNLQRLTGIADDDFISAAARMTDITGDASGAIDRLNLVADISVARKIDMAAAADMVARATEGEVGMLARILPGLDEQVRALGENADKGEVAALIFDRLAQFQGRAAEAADTTTGRFNILKQEIAATTENIGNAFLPMANGLTEKLAVIAKGVGEWSGEHKTLVGVVGTGTLALAGFLTTVTAIGTIAPVAARGINTITVAITALKALNPELAIFSAIAIGVVASWGYMTDRASEYNAVIAESDLLTDEMNQDLGAQKNILDLVTGSWISYTEWMQKYGQDAEQAADAVARIAATPLKPMNLQVTESVGVDPLPFDWAAYDEGMADAWAVMAERTRKDTEESNREIQAIWQNNRDAFIYHTGWLQSTYRSTIGTFADTEMTGKERREQIWGQFRSNVASYIADMTARFIFGELAKRAATLATATVGVAASQAAAASEVASANQVTASWMAAAYAKLTAFYAFSGPLAPLLAVGTIGAAIAGIGAVIASAMGAMKFQEGGVVPGTGSGDKVPALLEPGERVINRNDYAANRGAIESAIRGGTSGGGSHFHFHLDRDTAADDALRLRQLFETWVVPVIEQKQREGAFTRIGIPQ